MIMDILVGLFMIVTLAVVMFGEPFAVWLSYKMDEMDEKNEIIDVEVIDVY